MSEPRDETRFETLWAHRPFVRRLARALVRDAATADDVEQEVWRKATTRRPRDSSAVRSWLSSLVRNTVRDLARSEGARRRRQETVARPEAGGTRADVVAEGEALRRLVDAVMALPEPYRQTVLLRYWRGLKPAAIARETGVPVETVRTRIARARVRLRDRLTRDHGGDRDAALAAVALLAGGRGALVPAALGGLLVTKKLAVAGAAVLVLFLGVALLDGPEPRVPVPAGPDAKPDVVAATAPGVPAVTADTSPEPWSEAKPLPQGVHQLRGTVRLRDGGGIVPGAFVVASATGLRSGERRARADPEGRFVLDHLPAGTYRVAAGPTAGVRQWAGRFVVPGVDRLEVVLDGGAAAAGRVVDATTGRGLGGAEVSLTIDGALPWNNRGAYARGVTGEDGRWRIDDLPPGRVEGFDVRRSGWRPAEGEAATKAPVFLAAGATAVFDRALRPAGAIRGRILSPNGAPVPGAKVSLAGLRTASVRVKTDAAGRFAFEDVDFGEGSLRAWTVGDEHLETPVPVPVAVGSGETVVTDLVLDAAPVGRVEGRVVDDRGAAVAGAKVSAGAYGAYAVGTTDEVGHFSLDGVRAGEEVVVGAWTEAANGRAAPVHLAAGGLAEGLEILLVARHATVAGRVLGPDGSPAADATVHLVPEGFDPEEPQNVLGLRFRPGASTTPDGRFLLGDAPAGTWSVLATAPDAAPAVSEPLPLAVGERREGVELRLGPPHRVGGVVLAEGGGPVEGARIRVVFLHGHMASGAEVWATTDRHGRFSLALPVGGPYLLRVAADGYAPGETRLDGEETDGEIVLPRGRRISGRVVDRKTGAPLGGIPIRARSGTVSRPRHVAATVTAADGSFELGGLPEDEYVLSLVPWLGAGASRTGYEPQVVEGVSAGSTDVTFRLERGRSIVGRIVDEQGMPVRASYQIGASHRSPGPSEPENSVEQRTRPDGTFCLTGLRDGSWDLRVEPSEGSGFLPGRENAVEAGAKDVVIVLPASARIRGFVLDAAGRPVTTRGRIVVLRVGSKGFPDDPSADPPPGGFESMALSPRNTYTVVALDFEGGLSAVARNVSPADEPVRLVLRPGGSVSGRVLRPDGTPAGAGIHVQICALREDGYGSGLIGRETRTTAGGRFSFTDLPDLRYQLRAGGGDPALPFTISSVPVSPGATGIAFRLGR